MAAETFRITEDLVVEDRTGPGFESASKRVSAFDKVIDKMQERLKRVNRVAVRPHRRRCR